jgi:uncharacterized protein
MDTIDIRHQPALGRFHTEVDGHACILDYALADGRMRIRHTVVPQAVGGRGIAAGLVRAALDWARASGLRVVADCSYAAGFIQRHPEYQDLLDRA